MHLKKSFFKLLLIGIIFSLVFITTPTGISTETTEEAEMLESVEIREYEGIDLSSIDDFIENSIKGPQHIDEENYTLRVTGLVKNELELTYDEIIDNYQHYQKVAILNCVDGWSVTILWEGILLQSLLGGRGNPEATTVIFHAYDGYTTSLPLRYIISNDIIMAYKMNNVTLPPERGFPFQLVAESKLGYKWIKWITEIELSDDEDYRGYWESRGWSNDAELGYDGFVFQPPAIPEFPSWIILPLFVTITLVVIISKKKLSQKKHTSSA